MTSTENLTAEKAAAKINELKKEKELGNYQEKNNGEDCKRISEQP